MEHALAQVEPALIPTLTATRRSVLIEQAVALLGVSRRTVYYWIRDGRLQTLRTRCGTQRVLLSSIRALAGRRPRLDRAGVPSDARGGLLA